MKVTFIDSGREPQCKSNPAYPNGIDVDLAHGLKSCTATLPYPAPRCGMMSVLCATCGMYATVTVAGRADDPRSMKVPCKAN